MHQEASDHASTSRQRAEAAAVIQVKEEDGSSSENLEQGSIVP
jgi:hypothetical protein